MVNYESMVLRIHLYSFRFLLSNIWFKLHYPSCPCLITWPMREDILLHQRESGIIWQVVTDFALAGPLHFLQICPFNMDFMFKMRELSDNICLFIRRVKIKECCKSSLITNKSSFLIRQAGKYQIKCFTFYFCLASVCIYQFCNCFDCSLRHLTLACTG